MDCPVNHLCVKLMLEGKPTALVNELAGVLKGPIPWQPAVDKVEGSGTGRMWEGRVGDWILALADFDVSEQPGHKAGDRGQNLGISNIKAGVVIMGDGFLLHQTAKWLVERMEPFGAGKTGAAWRS